MKNQASTDGCLECGKRGFLADFYFANCRHNGYCRKCCEKALISAVKEKEMPKCLNIQCDAKMVQKGSNCMFQYFSMSVLQCWKKRDIIVKVNEEQKCQTMDCSGLIHSGKCNTCCIFYCQKCKKPEHPGKCKNQKNPQKNYVINSQTALRETVRNENEESCWERLCACFRGKSK